VTTREEIEAAERLERATSEEGFMSSYPDDSKYDYGTDVDIVVHAVLRAKADRTTRKAAIERATKEISHLLAMGCELSQITIEGIITRELEGDGNA